MSTYTRQTSGQHGKNDCSRSTCIYSFFYSQTTHISEVHLLSVGKWRKGEASWYVFWKYKCICIQTSAVNMLRIHFILLYFNWATKMTPNKMLQTQEHYIYFEQNLKLKTCPLHYFVITIVVIAIEKSIFETIKSQVHIVKYIVKHCATYDT